MNNKNSPTSLQKYFAEFVGTFFLLFVGVMASMSSARFGSEIGLLGESLAWGLAIVGAISAVGAISGAHINPAVSIALAATGKMSWTDIPGYIVSQLVGALLAVVIAKGLVGDFAGLGISAVGEGVSDSTAVIAEIVLTFLLVFVICSVGTDSGSAGRAIFPLAVGLVVTCNILAGGQLSGAAMNPARWFGPAVVGSNYGSAWVFLLGPFIGGTLGAFAYQFVRADE